VPTINRVFKKLLQKESAGNFEGVYDVFPAVLEVKLLL
jgi:hypothetical protein